MQIKIIGFCLYNYTSAVKSISFKSKVTCAVVGSNGVSTTGITITRMCTLNTFIDICERTISIIEADTTLKLNNM